jgi:hypothetical protein
MLDPLSYPGSEPPIIVSTAKAVKDSRTSAAPEAAFVKSQATDGRSDACEPRAATRIRTLEDAAIMDDRTTYEPGISNTCPA